MNKSTVMFVSAVIIIPAVVVSLAFYFSKTLKADISMLTSVMDEIDDMVVDDGYENKEYISQKLDIFNKKWKSCSEKWCFFFDHEAIHQIDIMTAEFESEIDNEKYGSALITSARIKRAFDMLSEHDTLNVSNFF
ncbi:MAG: DUF4363 family protein [Clostridia bacterium]|nr:DUF4363 family protein [Clostridia bacterium]